MDGNKRVILTTADGSPTIAIPDLGITYHSTHGAMQESTHIFLESGLDEALGVFPLEPIHIFEMGFGTGLNAFLTAMKAQQNHLNIQYTSLELYPLTATETALLNYSDEEEERQLFQRLHNVDWDKPVTIHPYFTLGKLLGDLLTMTLQGQYHLVYYDAFAPESQPQLWTASIFKKLYDAMIPNGILLTYCSKSVVRKAMQAAGFSVEKIPGPHGKREIVRARKTE